MSEERRLDEQAISKLAKTLLSDQIDTAQKMDVDIRTDAIKIVQGKIDSISITGKQLVTQQDLQVQELDIQTDCVDIDLFSLLLGKIKLNQTIDSTARFVVTEADINQNLQSDFILDQLPLFELNVDNQIVLLEFQPPMELRLPSEGKIVFSSNLQVSEEAKTQQVHFKSVIYSRTNDHNVLMEKFSLEEGQAISLDILVAFMEKLKELINSPYLKFNGTTFRIKEMNVHHESINFEVEAHTAQIPSF